MKKFLALFLTLTLLAGLTACKGREAIAEAQVVHVVTAPTDDATFVYEPEDPTQVLPGGQTIALVTPAARTAARMPCCGRAYRPLPIPTITRL